MTPTSLQHDPKHDYVIVTRLIRYKLHKIEFNSNVEAHKLVPYFNMSDDDFLKFAIRVK